MESEHETESRTQGQWKQQVHDNNKNSKRAVLRTTEKDNDNGNTSGDGQRQQRQHGRGEINDENDVDKGSDQRAKVARTDNEQGWRRQLNEQQEQRWRNGRQENMKCPFYKQVKGIHCVTVESVTEKEPKVYLIGNWALPTPIHLLDLLNYLLHGRMPGRTRVPAFAT